MNPTRRQALALAGAAGAALAAPAIAQSPWPNKPVRFVVPFPPGQAADIFARLMAEKLGEMWKQQVIVENKGGGSGIPATEFGKAAAPDGYTLMVVSSGTFGVNPSLYPDLPYKPLTDFLPISNIFLVPLVIVAHPSLPVNTLAELIALAKKEPGQLSYASAGPGTSQHLSMELFKLKASVDIVHIPYKGSGPAMADLLGGHVKLMMDSTASALNHIKDGRIKALAVTTARPAPAHAARDRGQGQQGHADAAERRGGNQADRAARSPAGARHAHPVRRVHQERDRHLGRRRPGHGDQARNLRAA